MALPIYFFRHLHKMYLMYRLATTHSVWPKSCQVSTADFRHQKQTSVWNCKW